MNVTTVAAAALIAVFPILFWGIPGGNDANQHYQFAAQIADAFANGDVYVSFAGNSNDGFGDIGLRFYPPLSYYLLAGAFKVTGSWFAASFISIYVIFAVGAVGVFFWTRELFGEKAALISAVLFTFAPFHLNEIYNNFLFAEFAASAVLPFCFMFVYRVASGHKGLASLGLAVSYGALIITHLPLTIIGSAGLFVYAVAVSGKQLGKVLTRLALSVFGGLALSSFYWIRMVTELSWVNHSKAEYFANIWSYDANFLFSPSRMAALEPDALSLWLGDLMLLAMLLVIVPSAILVSKNRGFPSNFLPVAILFVIAVFMTTPLSSPVWSYFPPIQRVQFPWRWLALVSLFGSMIGAAGLSIIDRELKFDRTLFVTLTAAVALLFMSCLSAFILKAPDFTAYADFEKRSESFSKGKTFEGWWPIWAKSGGLSQARAVDTLNRNFTIREWNAASRDFDLEDGAAQTVTLATFYYPYWKGMVNGNEVQLNPDENGLISITVPEGPARVMVAFIEPMYVRIANFLSVTGWVTALCVFGFIFLRKPKIPTV